MTHGGITGLGVLAIAALLLAGCTSQTADPGSSTTPVAPTSQQPSPSSSPTVAPAAAPGPRVELKCADLYSVDAVAKLIDADPIITMDEATKPAFYQEVANAQLGGLGCAWIGPDGTEVSAAEQLSIEIAPDSGAAYEKYAAADLKAPAKGVSFTSTAGDKSGYWCIAYGSSQVSCTAQMLVGTYWVSVTLSAADTSGKTKIPVSTVSNRMKSVLNLVDTRLAAAPAPVPQWVAPATTPPGFCDAGTDTSQVRAAFGVAGDTRRSARKPYIDAGTVGTIDTTALCQWVAKKASLDVYLLAGGSWVYPGFHTTGYSDGYPQKFTTVTVDGASSADLGCAEGYCGSTFAVGTTFVHVDFDDLGTTSKNVAALSALAKAVAAS